MSHKSDFNPYRTLLALFGVCGIRIPFGINPICTTPRRLLAGEAHGKEREAVTSHIEGAIHTATSFGLVGA